MYPNKSVSYVINRGHMISTVPTLLIIFGMCVLALYLGFNDFSISYIIGSVVAGLIMGWLYWSFITPRWKVWSLENVVNVHEWKRRAIREMLIWKDDSRYSKTEIWTYRLRQDYKAAALRFSMKEKFDLQEADPTLPAEKVIYFSKSKNVIQMSFFSFLTIIFFVVFIRKFNVLSLLFIGLFLYSSIKEYLQFRNRDAQLVLSEDGIFVINEGLYSWDRIRNEEVRNNGSYGKTINLRFEARITFDEAERNDDDVYFPVEIDIENFNISPQDFRKHLKTYRIRFENRKVSRA